MSVPASPPPRSRGVLLPVLGLAAAAALAWANSFSGAFVFDDRPAILANPTLDHLATAFSPPHDGGTMAGRPLVNFSFALNRAAGGTDVRGYHAVNLLIHLLAGLALFGLVRRTLDRRAVTSPQTPHFPASEAGSSTLVAFAAALLWLVHPLQTAAVTYVVQRAEAMMGLCFLLALYGFARATANTVQNDSALQSRARGWFALSVVACLAGMACKEVMAVAPVVILLYDRTFVGGSFTAALRIRGRYYLALAATWLLLAWLVATNAARAHTAGFTAAVGPIDYALTQCAAIVHYLRLVFWPHPLVFDYGTIVETNLLHVAPQTLLLGLLLATTALALKRAPVLGFFGAVFFLILAPSSSFVPVLTQTVAEHRMYLPLAVLAVGLVLLLHARLQRKTLLVMVPLAVALGAMTALRNRDYRDGLTLWADTVAKRPANARAHNNLGIELARAHRPAEAAEHYAFALQTQPDDSELHNNFGNVLAELGRTADALDHFNQSVRLKPGSLPAQLNLAQALLAAGRPVDAIVHFESAAQLGPLDASALSGFGTALLQTNRLPAAIAQYRKAVEIDPHLARAHYNLGLALARSGQLPEATTALRECTRLEPANVAARVNLANVLLLGRRPAEAIVEYEAALRLQPGDAQIQANLAQARAVQRRASP